MHVNVYTSGKNVLFNLCIVPTEESHYDRSTTSVEPTSGADYSDTTDSGVSRETEESTSKKAESYRLKICHHHPVRILGNFHSHTLLHLKQLTLVFYQT